MEARGAVGGTWGLFRYPGACFDSELYVRLRIQAVEERQGARRAGIHPELSARNGHRIWPRPKTRCRHKLVRASWSGETARRAVAIERHGACRTVVWCRWIFCGSGYDDYENGFSPVFEGAETLCGPIVHPQKWPEGLDLPAATSSSSAAALCGYAGAGDGREDACIDCA